MSISRLIDKDMIHTHTHTHTHRNITQPSRVEYSFAKCNTICSNMDGPRDYHTKAK